MQIKSCTVAERDFRLWLDLSPGKKHGWLVGGLRLGPWQKRSVDLTSEASMIFYGLSTSLSVGPFITLSNMHKQHAVVWAW